MSQRKRRAYQRQKKSRHQQHLSAVGTLLSTQKFIFNCLCIVLYMLPNTLNNLISMYAMNYPLLFFQKYMSVITVTLANYCEFQSARIVLRNPKMMFQFYDWHAGRLYFHKCPSIIPEVSSVHTHYDVMVLFSNNQKKITIEPNDTCDSTCAFSIRCHQIVNVFPKKVVSCVIPQRYYIVAKKQWQDKTIVLYSISMETQDLTVLTWEFPDYCNDQSFFWATLDGMYYSGNALFLTTASYRIYATFCAEDCSKIIHKKNWRLIV